MGVSTVGALSCFLPSYLRQDRPLLRTVVLDSCILSRGAGWVVGCLEYQGSWVVAHTSVPALRTEGQELEVIFGCTANSGFIKPCLKKPESSAGTEEGTRAALLCDSGPAGRLHPPPLP